MRADVRVLVVFSIQIAGIFCLKMLLFFVPWVRDWVVYDVVGLPQEIATHVASALRVGCLLALCMAGACLTRGLLIVSQNTGAIAVTSGLRIAAVAVAGVVGVVFGATNGAMLGITALVAALATEAVVLSVYLRRLGKVRGGLFES